MDETVNRRTWPGEGELELTRFARTLLDRGWRGPVAVEVLSAQARTLSIEDYARRAHDTTVPYWTASIADGRDDGPSADENPGQAGKATE